MADQVRRQRLLLECVSDLSAILEDFRVHIVSNEMNVRQQLLIAAMNRIRETVKVDLDLAHKALAEDMWCLSRPMLELVFNVAYLQITEDDEVRSFMVAHHKAQIHQLKQFEDVIKTKFTPMDDESRERLRAEAEAAEELVLRSIKPENWSKRKLAERISLLDKSIGLRIFQGLYRSTYSSGHPYVHGMGASIAYFHVRILGLPVPQNERLKDTNLGLSQVCQTLNALCVFLDFQYSIGLGARIEALIAKLDEAHSLSGLGKGNFTL